MGGSLHTEAHVWHRLGDNRTVTLVGLSHAADAEYWVTINRYLDACWPSALVQYEWVSPPSDEERDALSPLERAALEEMNLRSRVLNGAAAHAGLTLQRVGLPIREGWMNLDVTQVELMRMRGAAELTRRSWQDTARRWSELPFNELGRRAHFAMRNQGWLAMFPVLAGPRRERKAILEYRNAVGVNAALAASPAHQPVVLLWGAAHLPGMGELLAVNGFDLVGHTLFKAIDKAGAVFDDDLE